MRVLLSVCLSVCGSRQVLLNLLQNAARFTRQGFVCVRCSAEHSPEGGPFFTTATGYSYGLHLQTTPTLVRHIEAAVWNVRPAPHDWFYLHIAWLTLPTYSTDFTLPTYSTDLLYRLTLPTYSTDVLYRRTLPTYSTDVLY